MPLQRLESAGEPRELMALVVHADLLKAGYLQHSLAMHYVFDAEGRSPCCLQLVVFGELQIISKPRNSSLEARVLPLE